jgi:glycosyltransferase involved in cell wall biosynthesis
MNVGSTNLLSREVGDELTKPDLTPLHKEGGRRCYQPTLGASPLVTVITVIYNGAKHLPATIESVLAIKTARVEYIVIDGGSTDGTLEVLHHYEDHLDYWLSEKDAGIYDAMNKGIRLARGEYVYHLNIGDTIHCVPAALSGDLPPGTAGLAACVRIGNSGLHKPSAGLALRLHNTLHHQGCFYLRKSNIQYDTRYRVFADFDLNQRLIKSGQRFVLSDEIVASHDQGGVSHNAQHFHEVYEIVKANQGPLWLAAAFLYFKLRGLFSRMRVS